MNLLNILQTFLLLLAATQFLIQFPLSVALTINLLIFVVLAIRYYTYYKETCNRSVAEILLQLTFLYLVYGGIALAIAASTKTPELGLLLSHGLLSYIIKIPRNTHFTFPRKLVFSIMFISIVWLLSVFIRLQGTILPITTNIDGLAHLIVIKEFFHNGTFSLDLTQVNNAFTVSSYFPLFHIVFGPLMSSIPLGSQVILYNIVDLAFPLLTAITFYVIARSKGNTIALLLAVVHILMFERVAAYSSYFLLPQTFISFLGAVLLLSLICKQYISRWMVIFYPILLISGHFLVGSIWTLIFLFFWFFSRNYVSKKLLLLLLGASLYVTITSLIFETSLLGNFRDIIPDFEARIHEIAILTPTQLYNSLLQMVGVGSVLVLLYLFYSIFSKQKWDILLSISMLFTVILIVVQVPYSGKFLLILHYLLLIIIWRIFSNFIHKTSSNWWKGLVVLFTACAFIPLYMVSTSEYKSTLKQKSTVGAYTYNELEAIKQLQTLEKGVIVSDPLSMTIFEANTKHTTLGGVYTNIPTRIHVWKNLNESAYPKTRSYNVNYYVITNRTIEWLQQDESFINKYANEIWQIRDDSLLDCNQYRMLGTIYYNSSTVCIILANPHQ